ncbi:MAG TPA: AraC family transcriptional regulator [Thermoanaerobaculia bacterium]|nr:AraC family transcriptional regulator [Thermoanaerobaculia bacterium]
MPDRERGTIMILMRINPPAAALGNEHAILRGMARDYCVRGFEGPLSIKTVRRGRALWRTASGERILEPGRDLILNRAQRYDIEVDSDCVVETFCIFFRHGFAEDVSRGCREPAESLLDDPAPAGTVELIETIETTPASIADLLPQIEKAASVDADTDDLLIELVEALVARDGNLRGLAFRAPAVRASTRSEILRRVLRGRDRIDSSWDEPITLEEIATTAGMAPHHFHRSFKHLFGVTPLEYRTRLRVDAARRRLEAGDEPIQDVCVAVGFESVTSFTHLFRAHCGISPGRYRAAFRRIR